ncbi:MAG: molybdopterin dinucleotide binding domain-containing protein [Acidimicrobiia bacterium]
MRISPADAAALGVGDGDRIVVTTAVEVTGMMQPGHVSLPNGFGLRYPDEAGTLVAHGIAPNTLTGGNVRDAFAGTPWHKHIPARLDQCPDRVSA